MSIQWMRVVVDGAVRSALATLMILLSLRTNPRIWLNDFPADIREALPPKTEAEKRRSLWWGLPLFAILLGGPLVSTLLLERQSAAPPGFASLFVHAYAVAFAFNLVDLIVIDWLIICAWTPRWLVMAGTEGMAGYSNYRHHFRGFIIGCVASAVFALPAALLVYLT